MIENKYILPFPYPLLEIFETAMNYLIFCSIAFFLNIPFGFYRKPLSQKIVGRRLSFLVKMLIIHAPIPLVILLRQSLGIEKTFTNLAISIGVCILGQTFGSRILPRLKPFRPCHEQV